MLTAALLTTPGPRRRIPDPVTDPPTKWAWLGESGYGESGFEENPPADPALARVDATPHRPAFEKAALTAMASHPRAQSSDSHRNRAGAPWEGATPPSKRLWIHMESILPPIASQSPGATPQVLWGCLAGSSFPGEEALVSDPVLAERHLRLCLALTMASGHSQGTPSHQPAKTPSQDAPPPPPPGAGVGFFSWIKSPIAMAIEDGPLGRGWGRTGKDSRRSYHLTSGRHDPGMLRVCGFSYATTEGVVSMENDNEAEAIASGLAMVEKARYTANVTVESVVPFKLFTLLRAASCGATLPDWLIFPVGRCWLAGLSRFAPRGEEDPLSWVMRTGVACGEKTCSRMIPEPGAPWLRETGNPGIAARAMVSAITRSPFFQLGGDRAPDLISRGSLPQAIP